MSSTFPKLLLFILYVAITVVARAVPLVNSDFFAVWQAWMPIAYWILGLVFGYLIYNIDRLVDIYYANPESELSIYAKKYFRAREYVKGWRLVMHNKKLQMRLTFRSLLFHAIWVILALFTVTSTNNLFGVGFVLALGFHLLLDVWDDFLSDKTWLRKWYLWQINRDFTDDQLSTFLWVMTAVTLFLTYLSY